MWFLQFHGKEICKCHGQGYVKFLYIFWKDFYHNVHLHLAMVICLLGVLFNVFNILVFSHRDMRNPVTEWKSNLILNLTNSSAIIQMQPTSALFLYDNFWPQKVMLKEKQKQGGNIWLAFPSLPSQPLPGWHRHRWHPHHARVHPLHHAHEQAR